jgi:hypothetical protein
MRKDTRFNRHPREEIEARLPAGTLSDSVAMGVWNMMLQADDPSEVARWYRSYRDSNYCSVPRDKLRSMRDVVIDSMRESNKLDSSKRVEKKKGVHYDGVGGDWYLRPRTGA